MIAIYVPAAALVIGILMFALAANPKIAEIGKAMMWTGFLVTLFMIGHHWWTVP